MKLVPTNLGRGAGSALLRFKKNSPTVFFVGGVVGVVGAGVMACRATLQLQHILDTANGDVDDVKKLYLNADATELLDPEHETAYRKELAVVYSTTAMRITRLYGPSIVVGGISIAALTGSHIQLSRRNAALAAAYAVVAKAFEEYRDRVRTEIGEDRETMLYRGFVQEEIVNEEGKKEKVLVVPDGQSSPYARVFDEGNRKFQKDFGLNRFFIQTQEKFANERLKAQGHLFLNQVYESLGFPNVPEGQMVGWIWKDGDGDGYVDFGLLEDENVNFMNGTERCIWLDFNVDGVILEKI